MRSCNVQRNVGVILIFYSSLSNQNEYVKLTTSMICLSEKMANHLLNTGKQIDGEAGDVSRQ